MGLKYKFKKAEKIISSLDAEAFKELQNVCKEIQIAEDRLLKKGTSCFNLCKHKCEGLCCRNIQEDGIISQGDFVYILTLQNSMRDRIFKQAKAYSGLYPADCVFLEKGEGPCIFPPNVMPEICITSFCNSTAGIRKEIGLVKIKFLKLRWVIFLTKSKALKNSMRKFFKACFAFGSKQR
jgi:hypothetical protein